MNQPAPPPKLFRDEAKTGSIACPACGAPLTLKGFGGVQQIACSYCGTVSSPEDDGALAIVDRDQRERRASALQLYQRGTVDGAEWEIIGIVWREVRSDGVYPWQEFLLFNPYRGYRWLIYSMSDGQWSLGGPLPGAAKLVAGTRAAVRYAGETYKHFTGGTVYTTYVEGEFPWQVRAGDEVKSDDYICPPKQISIEVQAGGDGADLNFTQSVPISPREVWQAFAMPGSPPPASGIHPAAPNPHKTKFYWLAAAVLLIAWVAASIAYASARSKQVVYQGELPANATLTEVVEIDGPKQLRTLKFELEAKGMNNSWAFAEVLLVDTETEEAVAVGLEIDAWSGIDDGESWSEGTNPRRTTVGGVPGGRYLLQATTKLDRSGDVADRLELTITRDVTLGRYILLPLLVIVIFPIINLARWATFEGRRWANSDYAASWEP